MKKRTRKKESAKNKSLIKSITLRYLLIIFTALIGFQLFSFIFTPLTKYPVYWITSLFYDVALMGKDIILVNNAIPVELIPACIAGSAYSLLLILNLSVPKIEIKKRLNMIGTSFLSLLVLNILRIFLLTLIFIGGYSFFDATHKIFWYGISTIFVVGIWFAQVKLYKVKEIPFYSDIKFLYNKFIKR